MTNSLSYLKVFALSTKKMMNGYYSSFIYFFVLATALLCNALPTRDFSLSEKSLTVKYPSQIGDIHLLRRVRVQPSTENSIHEQHVRLERMMSRMMERNYNKNLPRPVEAALDDKLVQETVVQLPSSENAE
jgi:hypothetical protein